MSEHLHQAALFSWAAVAKASLPELDMLFAVPNGGHRHPATGRRLKAEGVKPGVPDIFLDVPRGEWHGLRLELKVGRNKPTKAQVDWMERLSNHGYLAVVCWGWESARDQIQAYLR